MREFTLEDRSFMSLALDEAKEAFRKKEVPIGAVLVFENKVIARGHNQVEFCKDATCHAEIFCLKEAKEIIGDWRLIGSTLYVTVEPCIMCVGALTLARVKEVVFGCFDKRFGALGGLLDLTEIRHPIHQILSRQGLMEEEAKELMQTFFQQIRKEKK